jgi:hypothetical protein
MAMLNNQMVKKNSWFLEMMLAGWLMGDMICENARLGKKILVLVRAMLFRFAVACCDTNQEATFEQ